MLERDDSEGTARAVGGALAGLLCKLDRSYGPWHDLDQQGMGFARDLVAAFEVDDDDVQMLSREGLNIIAKGPAGRTRLMNSVTMGRGSESHREFASLPVRRLCLRIINTIDHATRWAVFEPDNSRLAERICAQVTAYLASLSNMGAFEDDRFFVDCDAGLCKRANSVEHGVTILLRFRPLGCTETISFTLHQTVAGCRVATTAFAPVMEDCA
jgi:phage tail sheath protein FI